MPHETLEVIRIPTLLQFKYCGVYEIPNSKKDFKKIIGTLQCFSSPKSLEGRRPHDLENKGTCPRAQGIVKDFSKHKLWSIDVCPDNGAGKYRLVYFSDPIDANIGQVVAVYLDTHK
jgi:hypothetical protein